MNSVAYSSEFVCDNLARRKVRQLSGEFARANAESFTQNLLLPVAKKLTTSGRMARGEVGKMVERLYAQLLADPSVVDAEHTKLTTSRLSSHDEHRLTYVLASATKDEQWVDFITNEVIVSRKRLTINTSCTDFRIHRHAVARYMYREMRDPEVLLKDLSAAMAAAVVLGHVVSEDREDNHIAIPVMDGMLFGRVTVCDTAKRPPIKMVLDLQANTKPSRTVMHREMWGDQRVVVEIMTYVDGNSLTPLREHLHREVESVLREHAFGIKTMSDSFYYDKTVVEREDADRIYPAMDDALKATRELVQSKEWAGFAAGAGSHS